MDVNLSRSTASRQQVQDLHERLNDLLRLLDEAELHRAASYVSMALDSIQNDYPDFTATH